MKNTPGPLAPPVNIDQWDESIKSVDQSEARIYLPEVCQAWIWQLVHTPGQPGINDNYDAYFDLITLSFSEKVLI